jgi:hypothetical protein
MLRNTTFYSDRRFLTGLESDALYARTLTVRKEIKIVKAPAKAKTQMLILI